jgi:membrane associated rhomboid family serine protease
VIIPIGHDQSIRRWPWVTIGIIVLCTLFQVYSSFLAPSPEDLEKRAYAIAAEYTAADEENPARMAELERRIIAVANEIPMVRWGYRTGSGFSLNLITSAFVHGGWLHLIGNMLFLWLAGSALEDRYGRFRFALFYLIGAIAATYSYEATAGDGILLVGASGAVSACMGAFLLHFYKTKIRFWYLLMYRTGTFQWPAWFALPLWLAEQFLWVSLDSASGERTGVAYAAHIGGFAVGFVAGFIMSKVFPGDAADDEVEYAPSSNDPAPRPSGRLSSGRLSSRDVGEADAAVEERYTKCMDAITKRDAGSVRTLSSRVIIDLARLRDDRRVLVVYDAIAAAFTKVPLTVQAFAAAADAADRASNVTKYIAIADTMIAEHPFGLDTPRIMTRLARYHGDAGNLELEKQTLRILAQRFPRDEHGQKAARLLDEG